MFVCPMNRQECLFHDQLKITTIQIRISRDQEPQFLEETEVLFFEQVTVRA